MPANDLSCRPLCTYRPLYRPLSPTQAMRSGSYSMGDTAVSSRKAVCHSLQELSLLVTPSQISQTIDCWIVTSLHGQALKASAERAGCTLTVASKKPVPSCARRNQGRRPRQRTTAFTLEPDPTDQPKLCVMLRFHETFQMSLTKPISTSLSIGTFKFAILLRVLWRTNKKIERRNDRQYGDALRMFISSFPMT